MQEQDLTTVVIPALNAAATLDETLDSVRAQTHRALEIIVVDDGSTDATPQIARRHAQDDARVHLLQQANAGVAAARNAAIAAGQGEFIAPIDADDLWHPRKIEKQIAAMHRGGARCGLVYNWSALIDDDGRVIALGGQYREQGDVLQYMCQGNQVGNGSTPLMRAAAVRQAGGYDTTLRDRAAQGCEDFSLYLAIAERFEYTLVAEYLTGYRQSAASMSNDLSQMLRSFHMVSDEWLERRPDLKGPLLNGKANFLHTVYRRAQNAGRTAEARQFLHQFLRTLPYHAFKAFVYRPLRNILRRRLKPAPPPAALRIGQRFLP